MGAEVRENIYSLVVKYLKHPGSNRTNNCPSAVNVFNIQQISISSNIFIVQETLVFG